MSFCRLTIRTIITLICLMTSSMANAQQPDKRLPLFSGSNLNGWEGDPNHWRVEAGFAKQRQYPNEQ